jgi:hypothetical protein
MGFGIEAMGFLTDTGYTAPPARPETKGFCPVSACAEIEAPRWRAVFLCILTEFSLTECRLEGSAVGLAIFRATILPLTMQRSSLVRLS